MSNERVESLDILIVLAVAIIPSIIALLGVLIGLWVNWHINKKQFIGSVISQSRIHWIQDVRAIVAKYLSYMTNIKIYIEKISKLKQDNLNYSNQIVTLTRNDTEQIDQQEYEIEEDHPDYQNDNDFYYSKIYNNKSSIHSLQGDLQLEMDKMKETTQLLRLYLPKKDKDGVKNEDHNKLQELMDAMQNVVDMSYDKEEFADPNVYIDKLDEFTEEFSSYLKNEWEVAKKNK